MVQKFGEFLLLLIVVLIAALVMSFDDVQAATIPAPKSVTVKHRPADRHQRLMIGTIIEACDTLSVSPKVRVAAITTATQESSIRNLRGGHGTSVGLFQIINIHGPFEQRHNPTWSALWFCYRAKNVDYHRPGLSVGALSQAVQRSAYPHAYDQWVGEARRTVRAAKRRQLACLA